MPFWNATWGGFAGAQRPDEELAREMDALLERAAAAGEVRLESFDLPSLHAMHSDHLERKLGHPARILGLALAGEPRLRAPGYRAISAVLRAGLAGNWKAFWGAFRRGRERANQEPLA